MGLCTIFWVIMYTKVGITLVDSMSLDKAKLASGEVYRLFTYMFVHAGAAHFICNTFSLYIIGSRIEPYMGHKKFTALYILSGIIAGIVSYIFTPYGVAVGASGAIFGIVGGLIVLIKKLGRRIGGFDYTVALLYAIVSLSSGFLLPNVDNFAHIGGLLSGLLISLVLRLDK